MAATPQNPSFVLESIGQVAIEDRPIPTLRNPTDVLIRVNVTGICGSDIHYWQHGRIGDFVVERPMVLGHESSGTVVQVGPSARLLAPGDRVALEPGVPCRLCPFCKSGKYNLCIDMNFAATPPYDGTLAKFYVLPEDYCVKLPESVSLDDGALVEPLAVGVHAVRRAGVGPGDNIVVFGAGPIGLLCCAVARAFGAAKVIAVDIVEQKLEFAAGYAATGVFNSAHSTDAATNAAEIVHKFELGFGADAAIDASGAEISICTCAHVVRAGGTVAQVGMGTAEITFPITKLLAKEITLKGCFRYGPGDYRLAVDLLASGKVSVGELVTSRFSFADAEKAFQLVGGTHQGIKVLIDGPLD